MIRRLADRLSDWYNSRSDNQQVFYYFGFCLIGLLLLGLSIRYIHFAPPRMIRPTTRYIGKPSGPVFKDSLTNQKH